jgi:hypothetical protein
VVRTLIDNGVVVRENDPTTGRTAWRATADVEAIDLPENLQTLLIARIDRLEEVSGSAASTSRMVWQAPHPAGPMSARSGV